MAALFWDTSALVRRYMVSEPGSERVLAATEASAGNDQVISRLLPTEMASALSLKLRIGAVSVDERNDQWRRFRMDLTRDYRVTDLTEDIWLGAQQLVFRHPLRAADAIHLAAALAVRAEAPELVFWTADRRQAAAANAEGLLVELLP